MTKCPYEAFAAAGELVILKPAGAVCLHERMHDEKELVRIIADQNEVDTGIERRHARARYPMRAPDDRTHAEVVGNQHTSVPPILPQQITDDSARERRGVVA